MNHHYKNRDEYIRCRVCKRLTVITPETPRDAVTEAYKCQYGCEVSFDQPIYESPLQHEN